MTEHELINNFLERFEIDKQEAYLKIWKAAKIDFEDFAKNFETYGNAKEDAAAGMKDKNITKPLGKKLIAFALKLAGNRYGYKANYFIEDEGQGEDIDYNEVTHFVYMNFIFDFIDYDVELWELQELKKKEQLN